MSDRSVVRPWLAIGAAVVGIGVAAAREQIQRGIDSLVEWGRNRPNISILERMRIEINDDNIALVDGLVDKNDWYLRDLVSAGAKPKDLLGINLFLEGPNYWTMKKVADLYKITTPTRELARFCGHLNHGSNYCDSDDFMDILLNWKGPEDKQLILETLAKGVRVGDIIDLLEINRLEDSEFMANYNRVLKYINPVNFEKIWDNPSFEREHMDAIEKFYEARGHGVVEELYDRRIIPTEDLADAYRQLRETNIHEYMFFDLVEHGLQASHVPGIVSAVEHGLYKWDIEDAYKRMKEDDIPLTAENVRIFTGMELTDSFTYERETIEVYPETSLDDVDEIILTAASTNDIVLLGKTPEYNVDENGEFVEDNASKYLRRLLPDLKRDGQRNVFAVELDSNEQPLVDGYLSGEITRDEIVTKFEELNHCIQERTGSNLQYRAMVYLHGIEAANELGYEVVCYDERPEGTAAPGDEATSTWGTDRDWKAFQNLKTYVFDETPDANVVVYSTAGHSSEKPRDFFGVHMPGVITIPKKSNQATVAGILDAYTGGRCLSITLSGDKCLDSDINLARHSLVQK